MQARQRGKHARAERRQERAAATRVQAMQRGKQTRAAWRERQAAPLPAVAEQSSVDVVEDYGSDFEDDDEESVVELDESVGDI